MCQVDTESTCPDILPYTNAPTCPDVSAQSWLHWGIIQHIVLPWLVSCCLSSHWQQGALDQRRERTQCRKEGQQIVLSCSSRATGTKENLQLSCGLFGTEHLATLASFPGPCSRLFSYQSALFVLQATITVVWRLGMRCSYIIFWSHSQVKLLEYGNETTYLQGVGCKKVVPAVSSWVTKWTSSLPTLEKSTSQQPIDERQFWVVLCVNR